MAATGVQGPRWAAGLVEPVRVGPCLRLADAQESMAVLVASFERAGSGHAFLVVVDHDDCGAAAEILVVDGDELASVIDDIRAGARADGVDLGIQPLEPVEFRRLAEDALEARAVHDEEGDGFSAPDDLDDEDDQDGDEPPYPVLALLLRSRLDALPAPVRVDGPGGHGHDGPGPGSFQAALATLLGVGVGGPVGSDRRLAGSVRLPTKRKPVDGPAPIYQVKVGLRGAKPRIWRRLLLPADISLADLHEVIQLAFGWGGGHLHVFQTGYGEFGEADPELGHRAEAPVTLEQVASQADDRIRYVYDFGDDWDHEILVEKILDRDPRIGYPQCTGGRRAAPPDDCGGIWGYQDTLEILADPEHPEHRERLEWMGLDDAGAFDPDGFDPAEVNHALAALRPR
jgi:hypothetical protein